MAVNPSVTFNTVFQQLTKAEWVALNQFHFGMIGTPDDPPNGADDYRAEGLTAWWDFKGLTLTTAGHFAQNYTQWDLIDAHVTKWNQLGAFAYLSPGISSPTRLARLLNGAFLDAPNTNLRNPNARCFMTKQMRQPAPSGFYRMPMLNYNLAAYSVTSNGAGLFLKMFGSNPSVPGADISTTTVNGMRDLVNALPTGHRMVFMPFLKYKAQLPNGNWTFETFDNWFAGNFPGYWIDNLAAGCNSTIAGQVGGVHTNLGPLLDQLLAAGMALDYWISDFEFLYNVDDYKRYSPPSGYYTVGPGGTAAWDFINTAGRRWYEDLIYQQQNSKAAWSATYNQPDWAASPSVLQMTQVSSYETLKYMQMNAATTLYLRKAYRDAFAAIVLPRYPNCKLLEYDDNGGNGLWHPSTLYFKRYGGYPSPGACAGARRGRNRYASSTSGGIYKKNAGSETGTLEALTQPLQWLQCLCDLIDEQASQASLRLNGQAWLTPYDADTGFSSPANPVLAKAHAVAVCFCQSDPFIVSWFRNAGAPSLEAQNIMADAMTEVSAALYGKFGSDIVAEPRAGWLATSPSSISFSRLTTNNSGVSTVVTLTVLDNGSYSFSERENVINMTPVWNTVSDDTATVGVAFNKTITAEDPDANTITYSIVNGPTWLSINSGTGALSGTPTSASTVTVTARATDDGSPVAFADVEFDIVISGTPNAPPTFDPVGAQTATEGTLYQLTLTAEDPEATTITFTLQTGPTGMTITATGAGSCRLDWTPSETQGGATHPVVVRATDSGSPAAATDLGFSIVCAEVNSPPTFDAISNQTVNEHTLLTVTPANASDPDNPSQTLTWDISAFTYNGGAVTPWLACNPNTGVLTGTPDETMGGKVYTVALRVRDSGSPQQSFTRAFTVTVVETNTAPGIDFVPPTLGLTQDVPFEYQFTGQDTDDPPQTLTWSIHSGALAGMTLESSTGIFRWTPTSGQVGTNTVVIRLSDGALHDDQSVDLIVSANNHPPTITTVPDQGVREGSLLTVNLEADDIDPDDELTWAVVSGPGAINASTGVYTYTPAIGTAGTSAVVQISVTDDGTPNLSATVTFSVNIGASFEVTPISDATLAEGETLSFTATITGTVTTPRWRITVGPVNATIDEFTGLFTWSPIYGQAGTYEITLVAEDAANPSIYDAETFEVVVVYGPRQPFRKTTGRSPVRLKFGV